VKLELERSLAARDHELGNDHERDECKRGCPVLAVLHTRPGARDRSERATFAQIAGPNVVPGPRVLYAAGMRYRSADEDSARWDGFPFRRGDIVISTRSKSGTTWAQMICALLVFQDPQLPAALSELSPWLDWLLVPRAEVIERLREQLTAGDLARYEQRAAALAPADLLAWLHR
jgi:hypothetical protein